MEELLVMMLKAIVKNPKEIKVNTVETDESHVTLEIDAATEDKGVIIGKHGRTIKALGDIVNIKGFEEGKRAYLKLINNEQPPEKTEEEDDEEV